MVASILRAHPCPGCWRITRLALCRLCQKGARTRA